ncbi:hypothetical protein EIN_249170 [Entamoeba invadens IP1]|uniref:Leucine rich repeat containing protein BspA family protein n=1 Tax=Entamoeba invadens IP1 TaxID=370355 RepID=A0A0A1UEH2_ENTIV|nr:hypothetical protein EIN_249170 [Entamoeba invadens IP1]ELP94883.1 hypothetical protein EIN_249170 [Entamoeba invadens IP1]|eukprot:XP_004261654.1 hypothetical protein EIN_249170 [Entamoeba invadens IP1]
MSELGKRRLDSYTILIATQYFTTPEDFVNVVLVCRKFENTLNKFRYNPISVKTKTLFPCMETQYLYTLEDQKIPNLFAYYYYYTISYSKAFFLLSKSLTKTLQKFRCVKYTETDLSKFGIHPLVEKITHDTERNERIQIKAIASNLFEKSFLVTVGDKSVQQRKLHQGGDMTIGTQEEIQTHCYITLPDSIQEYGKDCFFNSTSLTSVHISNNTTTLQEGVFRGCVALVNVTLSTNMTSLENSLFSGCSKLRNIELPLYINKIGENAFSHCKSLTSISIPKSVSSIGQFAFCSCENLETINLNMLERITAFCFSECFNLSSVVLPTSVIEIETAAFKRCSAITRLKLTKSITKFGDSCFYLCNCKLFKDYILPERCFTLP